MKNVCLALIGFGHVNQELVELLLENTPYIEKNYGVRYTIVGVCYATRASLYNPRGLNLNQLLRAVGAHHNLETIPAPQHGWDAPSLSSNSNAQVIVEASPTDLTTDQPAINHVRLTLECGKHVVTANKGPVA